MMDHIIDPSEVAKTEYLPTTNTALDFLLMEYMEKSERIDYIASLFEQEEYAATIKYFLDSSQFSRHSTMSIDRVFEAEPAKKSLSAGLWQRVMTLTGVYECMDAESRTKWNESIRENDVPLFVSENVVPTITSLLAQKSAFFANRVDGIFQNLSRNHVTNVPEGFSKRMIIDRVLDEYGSPNYRVVEYIHDLRHVVGAFTGAGVIYNGATQNAVRHAADNFGEWLILDGGAIRMKVFKKGTAHLEIHPDMAWRLNSVLAQKYPLAIPSEFRSKPKKTKTFDTIEKTLSFEFRRVVTSMTRNKYAENKKPGSFFYNAPFGYQNTTDDLKKEVCEFLGNIGGVVTHYKDGFSVEFDHDPTETFAHISTVGTMPDVKRNQFYPTPANVAEYAVDVADIEDEHDCLEPSAGTGGLARFMPKTTRCVEISPLFAKSLVSQGFEHTRNADFIEIYPLLGKFDRIVMNPPYSEGRWKLHLEAALTLLKPDGVLVAVLPMNFTKDDTPGYHVEVMKVFHNQFDRTSLSVQVVRIAK